MAGPDKNRVEQYFRAYPKAKVLFFTADNKGYLEQEDAVAAAAEKGIEAYSATPDGEITALTSGKKVELTLTPADAEAILKELAIDEKGDYKQYQALAKALGLTVEQNKKAHIAALQAKKDELTTTE